MYLEPVQFKKEIEEIKNMSIVDFCNKNNIELFGRGKYRYLKEHDSCVIDTQKNMFIWNSTQKKGDIINFVQALYNTNFNEAIKIISGKELISHSSINIEISKTQKEIKNSFKKDLMYNSDMNRTFAYLIKKRFISKDIIELFISKDLIAEDKNHNIIFKMKDKENKNIIGIYKRGTTDIKYNYLNENSDIKGFSFKISDNNNYKKIFFVEASIDLMSFYELYKHRLYDSLLVSMQGLKYNCILENIKYYNIKEENVFICVDNDKAGHSFAEKLKKDHNFNYFFPKSKDWNEELIGKKKEKYMNDKNDYIEKKNKDMDIIIDKLNNGVKDIFTSGKYKEFLLTMSKFHNYSINNCILINLQNPNATKVAGYKQWQEDFQRNVNKGEKALSIIAPCFKNEKSEKFKLDNNGNKIPDGKGNYIKETIISKTIAYFRKVNVFDISQTSGKELPEIAKKLDKDFDNPLIFQKYITCLKNISPVPIRFDEIKGNSNGYFNISKQEIVVDKNLSQYQKIKTTIHEITHSLLHNPNISQKENIELNKCIKEIQAESSAYVVCNHFNIDTSEYSFGYVASWGNKLNIEELKEALNSIRNVSSNIINSIEKEFSLIEKNVSKEKSSLDEIINDLHLNNNKEDKIIEDNLFER